MERFKANLYQLLLKQSLDRYKEIEGLSVNQAVFCYKDKLQFFIIIMKCLRYAEGSGAVINTERLKDELRLWTYYVNGETNNENLMYFGLIPVAIVNHNTDDLNRAVRQYLGFFDVKIHRIPEYLHYAYFIQKFSGEVSIEDALDRAKKCLIEFSYRDFFEDEDKGRLIEFEKARILQISRSLNSYLEYLQSIGSWCDIADSDRISDNDREWLQLIGTLYSYLTRMAKGQVKPISYAKRDSKLYNQKTGNVIIHENFGETVVLLNEKTQAGKTIIVNTRYGCYKFNN